MCPVQIKFILFLFFGPLCQGEGGRGGKRWGGGKFLLAKGEMGNSFHLAEFVDLDFFFFFFSFISWVSHISVKCECVTDSSISETLFDFWHSTCHENGTSIQSFDYWSSCPEFPSISNILLILKRWKRRRRWTLSFCFYFNVKRRKTITKEGIDL